MPSAVEPPYISLSQPQPISLQPIHPKHPEADAPARPPVSPLTPKAGPAQLVPPSEGVSPPRLHTDEENAIQNPATQAVQRAGPNVNAQPLGLDGNYDASPPPPPRPNRPLATPHGRLHGLMGQKEKAKEHPQPRFEPRPEPGAINLEDNTDAAALRAALSILEIQKEKSRTDIKTLQKLKQGLQNDPQRFTEALVAGKLREEKCPDNPLYATFAKGEGMDDGSDDEDVRTDDGIAREAEYPTIPTAQNVIRQPAINWAKYHIVGESLEKMHEEQRRQPLQGEPSSGSVRGAGPLYGSQGLSGPAALEHHVYRPYDPLTDRKPQGANQQGANQRQGVQTRKSSGRGG